MIYRLLNYTKGYYARTTKSKKACFNYFIKLKSNNISTLCVLNDEEQLKYVVNGYYNIYEFLKR